MTRPETRPVLDLDLDMLFEGLRARTAGVGGPRVVAIDGRSGAGESTLARMLRVRLAASVVEGDDFDAGGTGLRDDPPLTRFDLVDPALFDAIVRTDVPARDAEPAQGRRHERRGPPHGGPR